MDLLNIKKTYLIYRVTFEDGSIYVGISSDPIHRVRMHKKKGVIVKAEGLYSTKCWIHGTVIEDYFISLIPKEKRLNSQVNIQTGHAKAFLSRASNGNENQPCRDCGDECLSYYGLNGESIRVFSIMESYLLTKEFTDYYDLLFTDKIEDPQVRINSNHAMAERFLDFYSNHPEPWDGLEGTITDFKEHLGMFKPCPNRKKLKELFMELPSIT